MHRIVRQVDPVQTRTILEKYAECRAGGWAGRAFITAGTV